MEKCQNIKLERTIGSGTFGKVKRAVYVPTGHVLAVKILNKSKIVTKKDGIRIERQISILKRISHPNLLKLYQLIVTPKNYMLVTQLAEGEELYQRINRKGNLSEQESGLLFAQLLDGVMHLKRKGIAHRDIKPENIIVEGDKLTLIDYGLGGLYAEGQKLWSSCGSHCYAAPEMMNGKHYDPEKSQVWALGVTLYAMLSGNLPFQHDNPTELLKIMLSNKYQQISHISSALQQLLRHMLEAKPSKRYTLRQVKEHVWVKAMQHEFFEEEVERQKQWNEELLKEMGRESGLSREQLVCKIQEGFGQENIAYSLRNQQKQQEFPVHSGPVHLNYLFKTVPLATVFITSQSPTLSWLSRSQAHSSTHRYTIKQLKGGFFYVTAEPL